MTSSGSYKFAFNPFSGTFDNIIDSTSIKLDTLTSTVGSLSTIVLTDDTINQTLTGNKGYLKLTSAGGFVKIGSIASNPTLDAILDSQGGGINVFNSVGGKYAIVGGCDVDSPGLLFASLFNARGTEPVSWIVRLGTSGFNNTGPLQWWSHQEQPTFTVRHDAQLNTDSNDSTEPTFKVYGQYLADGVNGVIWSHNTALRPSFTASDATKICTNVNADLLDGLHASAFQPAGSYENPLTFNYPFDRTADTISLLYDNTDLGVDGGSKQLYIIDSGINHNSLTNTHNLTTDIDHDSITNTHNLTTDIDHNSITNTHNLTTDIDHNALTNYDANRHFLQTDITNISTAFTTGLVKVTAGTGALSIVTDNSSDWTSHLTSDGSSHTFINQDVTTTGTPTFAQLTIDNLVLNGNTISSSDTNGNIILSPNGSGDIFVKNRLKLDEISDGFTYIYNTSNVYGSTDINIKSELGGIYLIPYTGFSVVAPHYKSTIATGTAPLSITSTTVCTNLNADMVDGAHNTTFTLDYVFDNGKIIDGATSAANAVQIGNSGATQKVLLYHDATNGYITTGTGDLYLNPSGNVRSSKAIYNAVWNDYSDFWKAEKETPVKYGMCYSINDNGLLYISDSDNDDRCVGLCSDTFGYATGDASNAIPISIGGFVLAYCENTYKPGTKLTNTKSGTLRQANKDENVVAIFMKKEDREIIKYPDRDIIVDRRCWVKIR